MCCAIDLLQLQWTKNVTMEMTATECKASSTIGNIMLFGERVIETLRSNAQMRYNSNPEHIQDQDQVSNVPLLCATRISVYTGTNRMSRKCQDEEPYALAKFPSWRVSLPCETCRPKKRERKLQGTWLPGHDCDLTCATASQHAW